MKYFKQALLWWDKFWFSPASALNLAVFRIFLATNMFVLYLSRFPFWKDFYSEDSFLPRHLAPKMFPIFYRPFFNWYFWPDSSAGLMHALFLLGLICVALGLGGRVVSLLTWVLHISFIQRNYTVCYGGDIISAIFLLYLSFAKSNIALSLDAFILKKYFKREIKLDLLTSVFYRMLQIQLCIIYGFTGMEKLKGASWWDGTALWTVFANSQMTVADMSWTKHVPFVLVFFTFMTVIFELYFPVLVWIKKIRYPLLAVGVSFHLGIGISMSIMAFALVMLAPYFLFVQENDLKKVLRRS